MTEQDIKRWQAALEVGPNATVQDIKNSYLRLRRLYGGGSIVLEPLADEFPEKRRMKILVDIEEAYAKLLELHRNKTAPGQDPGPIRADAGDGAKAPEGEDEWSSAARVEEPVLGGAALRRVRERRGIELVEISKQLKLRVELLKALEEERFEILPEEIYLKTHLKNLAACLGLAPARMVEDYIARYREWKRTR